MSASWKVLPRARASPDERSDIMKTIGVVVGGTFTDIIYGDMQTGEAVIRKVSATPDDPPRAAVAGIAELGRENGIRTRDVDFVFHGATTPTNAVLEHCGARTGRVTNEGFRDRPYRSSPAGQAPFHHAGTPGRPPAGQGRHWTVGIHKSRNLCCDSDLETFVGGSRGASQVAKKAMSKLRVKSAGCLARQCNRRPRPAAREVGLLPTDRRCGRFALFRLSR
jgi:hypothetical protein